MPLHENEHQARSAQDIVTGTVPKEIEITGFLHLWAP
jgi:hypothetical protein